MTRYLALIDGADSNFGVVIPDCPGAYGAGKTVEAAIGSATAGLSDWLEAEADEGRAAPTPRSAAELLADQEVAEAIKAGAVLASVPAIRESGRNEKVTLSVDSGLLSAIDAEAKRQGVTRSGLVAMLARRGIPGLG